MVSELETRRKVPRLGLGRSFCPQPGRRICLGCSRGSQSRKCCSTRRRVRTLQLVSEKEKRRKKKPWIGQYLPALVRERRSPSSQQWIQTHNSRPFHHLNLRAILDLPPPRCETHTFVRGALYEAKADSVREQKLAFQPAIQSNLMVSNNVCTSSCLDAPPYLPFLTLT